jgi:hypothetical protein
MGDFYRGGRRTYGSALFIISMVLLIGWLRSGVVVDQFDLESQFSGPLEESYFLRSNDNAIRFIFRSGYPGAIREEELIVVYYAVITLPLALIAACLMFWKARKNLQHRCGSTPEI